MLPYLGMAVLAAGAVLDAAILWKAARCAWTGRPLVAVAWLAAGWFLGAGLFAGLRGLVL